MNTSTPGKRHLIHITFSLGVFREISIQYYFLLKLLKIVLHSFYLFSNLVLKCFETRNIYSQNTSKLLI